MNLVLLCSLLLETIVVHPMNNYKVICVDSVYSLYCSLGADFDNDIFDTNTDN